VWLAMLTGGGAFFSASPSLTPCKNGVTMLQGQADIDSHPSGTTFCLSGTHNWTLTPKSNDRIMSTGNAVLDGNHTTSSAVVAAPGVSGASLWFVEIRNYQTQGDAFGAITTPDPPNSHNWTLVGLNVHDNGTGSLGAGVELGTGWVVVGGHWYFNRQEGLTAGGGASNDTITSYGSLVPEIDHNGFLADHVTYGGECGHEAGGFKWVGDGMHVTHAKVHDNACSGLWADINSAGAVIDHNTITNNWNAGISWEISRSASITHNAISGNGSHTCGFPIGAGIVIADSGATTEGTQGPIDVGFNAISNNCGGGVTLADGLSTGDAGADCPTNVLCGEVGRTTVHDNTFTNTGKTGYDEGDGDGPGEGQAQGNSFANNTGTVCGFGC
jgi:parallel beta-helix repeat protein